MDIEVGQYLEYRQQRLEQCRMAYKDPTKGREMCEGWSFAHHPEICSSLLKNLKIADTPDINRLVRFVVNVVPDRVPRALESFAEWDQWWLEHAVAGPQNEENRAIAAFYLIGRLGEEIQRRERDAWSELTWQSNKLDDDAKAAWRGIFNRDRMFDASKKFRKLWGEQVKQAFAGVGSLLRLPPGMSGQHLDQALDQLDFFGLGAHRDLAMRVLETEHDPILAVGKALSLEALARTETCLNRRDVWAQARSILEMREGIHNTTTALLHGTDLVVFIRLLHALEVGHLSDHPLGLPGWGIVVANRSRIRGRLRVMARDNSEALLRGLMAMPALYNRTAAAMARHCWDWAWREARTGFGFDAARLTAPGCDFDPNDPVEKLVMLGPADEPAILTLLLLILGRGCFTDLENWLAGAPSSSLSKTFYRCLKLVPDRLADPMAEDQRVRRYSRLFEHLADGGIEPYVGKLHSVAQRIALVPIDRKLKASLHQALLPEWQPDVISRPDHHLPTFVEAFVEFMSTHRARNGPGRPRLEVES